MPCIPTNHCIVSILACRRVPESSLKVYAVRGQHSRRGRIRGASNPFSLSPVIASLLAMVALLSAAVCAIIVAVYRKHFVRTHGKQPPSTNALYSEGSIDSFPKRDTLPSYTASPKVDYSSRYELKMDGDEDDPDIIPVQFDKKPLDDFSKPQIGMEGDTIKIYSDHSIILPNSGSISFVNRGVTARGVDISSSRHEVVTAARKVRESCI